MGVDNTIETQVLVIGAGPGGYVSAIRAAQLGLDVTLVERENVGGVCLNHGCIPSKALISTTDLAHNARNAHRRGINADITVDFERMIDWKDGVVEQLTNGVEQLCEANGVRLIDGTAQFTSNTEARILSADSTEDSRIAFENAIIATGSRPTRLPGFEFGDEPILSSRDVLALEAVPEDMIVIGAGYIGLELATVLAKSGASITVIEALESVLPGFEDDVSTVVRDRAEDLGIEFHLGEAAQEWERTDEALEVTATTQAGETNRYSGERVLVVIGREPVTDTLKLENTDIKPTEDGFLPVDEQGQTGIESIYAIGDVAGEPMLAHKASKEGLIAAHAIAGDPLDADYQFVPTAVFTDPEIGTVGLTKAEAEEAGVRPVVGRMPFNASGRAMTMGDPAGFVRLVAIKESAVLIGAQIVGPDASELVAELCFAIEQRVTLDAIAETIHIHPTLTEAVMEAAENAAGKAIHTSNR